MSKSLPYSMKDVHYDNAKFRQRSCLKVITQNLLTNNVKRDYVSCSTGKFLVLLMIGGLAYLMFTHTSPIHAVSGLAKDIGAKVGDNLNMDGSSRVDKFWRKLPRLPPRLSPDEIGSTNSSIHDPEKLNAASDWRARQQSVKNAFIHAWSGYKNYAMGHDELMPLSQRGVDGLGGLGATVVDALDTAIIMGIDEVVSEAGSWIEKHLPERISQKGQVNLFETIIRVVGGLLSAYHLSGGEQGKNLIHKGPNPCLCYTSSLIVGRILSSSPSGEFSGGNIRLGSRGDSYYEYLLKVWLQQRDNNVTYLHDMYEEAMKGVRHLLVRKSIPNGLVFVGELPSGPNGAFSPKMDHLVCFLSGNLALGATKGITKKESMKNNLLTFEDLENLKLAEDLAKTCYEMYSVTSTGLAPEIAYFNMKGHSEEGPDGGNKSSKYVHDIIIKPADRHNLLRPETVESLFILYRITEDPKYVLIFCSVRFSCAIIVREWGWEIFKAFEKHTKVDSGGYSSLDDVTTLPPRRRDKMETFFLGETLKYLYLLFGDNTVIPLDEFVFNTEAHPFPIKLTTKSE
ncbi:alpha-mannosidase 3 [Actinidia rufa]|uniref:alpha-1,2-Mannosidase n=1 Tax=Actinidia rufa TaxID=165716 RepID=A0A7J0DVE9_9ERIC|nr:alpha-mannosidase 3 [Actinidia rufa]